MNINNMKISPSKNKIDFFQKVKNQIKLYNKYKFLFILMSMPLITLIIFNYIPMYGLIIIFKDFKLTKGIWGSPWNGLENLRSVLALPRLWSSFANSFIINIYAFIVGFPLTIIFTLLLNEVRHIFTRKIIQTISYLPHFLSWIIVCSLVVQVLSPEYGLINKIIVLLGGDPVYFLIKPQYIRSIIVFSGIWKGLGWSTIIFLAALAGASQELYDAAKVDGAGRFLQARHVSLPAMYPVITISLIFSLSGLLGGGNFEQVYNLVNSQTLSKGEVLSTYIFTIGLTNYQYSFSAALGLLNTLIAIFFLYIVNRIASKFSEYTIW